MRITVFLIRLCITCIVSYLCSTTWLILLSKIDFSLLYSVFIPYHKDCILNTGILMSSFSRIFEPERLLPVITINTITYQVSSQKLTCCGKKTLITIHQQTFYYINSFIGSSYIFL